MTEPGKSREIPAQAAIRGNSAVRAGWHAARTAERNTAFFLPHLKSGMTLLDCGCGEGTITLGLAEAVAPGQVTGVDLDERRIEKARARAAEQGINNITYQVGDVYKLPFAEGSFDAALQNSVFQHLDDPLRASREIHRVLAPGGIFGASNSDHDGWLFVNAGPLVNEALTFYDRVREIQGTNHFFGKHLPSVLRRAGFENVEGSASCETYGTPEAIASYADISALSLEEPAVLTVAREQGWADEETVERWCVAIREWGADPDSWAILMRCEAVGFKP